MADNAFSSVDTSIYRQPQQDNPFMTGMKMAGAATAVQTGQFDLHMKQLGAMRDQLSSLLADPTLDHSKVQDAAVRMVANGLLTPQMAATELGALPRDPAGLRQALTNHLMANMSATERLNSIARPTLINDGNSQRFISVNQANGTVNPMGGASAVSPNYISPETASQPTVVGYGPKGQEIVGTRRQMLERAGDTSSLGPTPQGAPGAPAQPVRPAGGVGAGAVPAAPQPAPQAAPAASAANPYGGIIRPEPGTAEATARAGEASGAQFAADRDHAAKITERTFPLRQAIPALERLGKTGTGPGTETFNQFKSFLQSAGIPGIDVNKIKDFDEAKKYLTDYVNRTGNSGTNDKLAAAFAGNPSVGISNAAAVDVAKSAVALDRMRAAQAREFQKTGLPESKYAEWAANWNAKQDPRAYGADLMGPAKVKILLNNMKTPEERARFAASLRAAHDNGLTSTGAQ